MEEMFKINYGVIVLSKKEIESGDFNILHFGGYEHTPTESDISNIREEALYDKDFELIQEYDDDDIIAIEADESTVNEYKDILSQLMKEEQNETLWN